MSLLSLHPAGRNSHTELQAWMPANIFWGFLLVCLFWRFLLVCLVIALLKISSKYTLHKKPSEERHFSPTELVSRKQLTVVTTCHV